MRSRARRTVPRQATRALVNERDVDALEILDWGEVLATRHFSYIYRSRRVAQRRLRALLDHGLVRARTQGDALDRDTIFVLTAAGAAKLAEVRGFEQVRPGTFPRPQKLAHVLTIRDTFVAFLSHAKDSGLVVDDIHIESDDGLLGLREARLVPDLIVRYHGRDAPLVMVEVDLGHERRGVLADKLSRYDRYLGTTTARLLFLASTGRRADSVAARFREAFPGRVFAVELAKLREGVVACSHGVFAPPVRAERIGLRVEHPVSLRILPTSAPAFRIVGRETRAVRSGRDGE